MSAVAGDEPPIYYHQCPTVLGDISVPADHMAVEARAATRGLRWVLVIDCLCQRKHEQEITAAEAYLLHKQGVRSPATGRTPPTQTRVVSPAGEWPEMAEAADGIAKLEAYLELYPGGPS